MQVQQRDDCDQYRPASMAIKLAIISDNIKWRLINPRKTHMCACCYHAIPAKSTAYFHEYRGKGATGKRHVYQYVHAACFAAVNREALDLVFGRDSTHPASGPDLIGAEEQDALASGAIRAPAMVVKRTRGADTDAGGRPFGRLTDRQLWWSIAAVFAIMILFAALGSDVVFWARHV